MPRTKISKAQTKRIRHNSTEDRKEELIRELDIETENMTATQQIALNEHLKMFDRTMSEIKASFSSQILKMTVKEICDMV